MGGSSASVSAATACRRAGAEIPARTHFSRRYGPAITRLLARPHQMVVRTPWRAAERRDLASEIRLSPAPNKAACSTPTSLASPSQFGGELGVASRFPLCLAAASSVPGMS